MRCAGGGDRVAHTWREAMEAAVIQLGGQFAAEDEDDVAAVAPVVGEVAGGIADHADASVADLQRAPEGGAGFAWILDFGNGGPVGQDERVGDGVHVGSLS